MKNNNFNFGIVGLIIGVCGLFSLFIVPIVVLPLLALTIIFSVIGIRKDSSVYGKIGLGVGALGFVGLVIIGFVGVDMDLYLPNAQNPNPDGGSVGIKLPEAVITIGECEKLGGEVYNVLEETEYEGFLVGRIDELPCDCYCRVDDYSACKTFFNGCNTCYVNDENGDIVCTEMDCENLGEAYCLEFW